MTTSRLARQPLNRQLANKLQLRQPMVFEALRIGVGLNRKLRRLHYRRGRGSNGAMRYADLVWPHVTLLICFCQASLVCGDEPNDRLTAALQAALAKDLTHAREWLDQRDYKSLAQSASNIQLLAELIKARSDDSAWQVTAGKVVSTVGEAQVAARSEDAAQCKAALDDLEKAASAVASMKPTGRSQPPPRAPTIRSLMLTMDATLADAKVSLLTGDTQAAKKQGYVLAELARLVSNSRNTEQWSELVGDFAAAATTAATATENDPKTVRQLLRGVAERCDGCHEKSRMR